MKHVGLVIACGFAAAVLQPCGAAAATVSVLSGAAVEPGLKPVAELFARQTGDTLRIEYATGPEIRARIEAGERPDLVIAPAAVISALGARLGAATPVGEVGVGVAVRAGARRPNIADEAALKVALRDAATVIFSRGTGGVYVEQLLKRLGLDGAVRTERVANGGEVVTRLARGAGDEVGLSAMTELALGQEQGIALVGPLPTSVQNYTLYSAGPVAGAAARPEVGRLVALLGQAEARVLLDANGLRSAHPR